MKHPKKNVAKSRTGKDAAMIFCQFCHATTLQIRSGKSSAGLDIYHCEHCDQLYIPEWKRPASSEPEPAPVNVAGSPELRVEPASSTSVDAGAITQQTVPISTRANAPFFSKAREHTTTSNSWGWLPEIALLESLGLVIVALAFAGTRVATATAENLLWIGLTVMILPIALRLASTEASRRERIALVLLLGMALYLVKVMHSPIAFTFPDELTHLRNAREVVQSQRLFQENPVQPVTAYYPGLPIITSTLSSLSGLSIFHAGLLVIGVARLIMFLSLYLLFELVSGSGRVAGLATLLYMANPNFLYWTAEYAYEPLALPLLVFVLFMVAKRETESDRMLSGAWTVAAMFGLLMVVITHHMSSYILTVLLVVITVLFIIHSRGKRWGPWPVALLALFATSMWLIFVANLTLNYLSPVLTGAVNSVFQMIAEEETGRELFKSTTLTTESSAPLWEQIVAIGSVILVALGLPFGVFEIWKQYRSKVIAILLGGIALSYLPVQLLRLTKAGWETANRSSEFLFIGIGFVLALGIVRFWLSRWTGWTSKLVLAGLGITLFFGGLIAGWPPRARLARPYVIAAGSHVVRPQVITVSEWVLEHLGPDNRIAASKADAKVMGAYDQHPFTDNGPIKNLFLSEEFGNAERKTLLKRDIQYVVSDRKVVSWDHMIGYYFYSHRSSRISDLRLIESHVSEKLEGLEGVPRLLDSGDIVIYGVEMHLAAYKESLESAQLDSHMPMSTTPADSSAVLGRPIEQGTDSTSSPELTATSPAVQLTADQLSLDAEILPPGCMWYVAQPGELNIDLSTLSSLIANGDVRMKCLDWSVP